MRDWLSLPETRPQCPDTSTKRTVSGVMRISTPSPGRGPKNVRAAYTYDALNWLVLAAALFAHQTAELRGDGSATLDGD